MSPTKQARGTQTPSVTERRKNLGRNQAQSGGGGGGGEGSSPPARRTSSLLQLQQSQSVSGPLVPGVFPDGCLGDEVLTGDLSLGLIYVSWSPLTFRAVEVVSRC